MEIEEFLVRSPYYESWEEFCDASWGVQTHHIWDSLTNVEMSNIEHFELYIAIIERLLREKRLVFGSPEDQSSWPKGEDGLKLVWCAEIPTILHYLREYLPDPHAPSYNHSDAGSYQYFPVTAWLGRGATKDLELGDDQYDHPMSLWTDGTCIARASDWKWVHLDPVPKPRYVRI
ncbi:hypothetical protein HFV00_06985 [Acidithiobacillus sp. VAN18-4]|nr:hypothetical protein [Acidithiobacillus sp. BN09-2]MBU2796543.1 hypothetical protein [Acidithiobacillus sp. VAN18-2]MBU2799240.1 hypothetical protein [Acidithiobacillus sp. VAN18-4]